MTDAVASLIRQLSAMESGNHDQPFLSKLASLIIQGEAERLLARSERISSGHFENSESPELAAMIHWVMSSGESVVWSLTIDESLLSGLPQSMYGDTLALLSEQLERA